MVRTIKYDTVRVLMLVCDTSEKYRGYVYAEKYIGGNIVWQFGYEVRIPEEFKEIPNPDFLGINRACAVNGCELDHSSPTIKNQIHPTKYEYLDQDKKPLKKSIIVWDTKKIK